LKEAVKQIGSGALGLDGDVADPTFPVQAADVIATQVEREATASMGNLLQPSSYPFDALNVIMSGRSNFERIA
jgi:hypothetical protein